MEHKYLLSEVEQGLGQCLRSQCFNPSEVGTLVSMGVLETAAEGQSPHGRLLACGVSRSSTLRGEQALIFNRKRSKSHQDNRGNETNGSSRLPMCVRMNWVNERKMQEFWEPTQLLQGVVRGVHVV